MSQDAYATDAGDFRVIFPDDNTAIAIHVRKSDAEYKWIQTGFTAREMRERLVGATIVDVQLLCDEGGAAPWPCLSVRTKTGEHLGLGVARDAPGNGGGFLHLLDVDVEVEVILALEAS
jgi:hypothetical protein